jgi:thioredoxin reductase (NADPH)
MEIVQPEGNGERAVAKHDPGEFTGEINMISWATEPGARACHGGGRIPRNQPRETAHTDRQRGGAQRNIHARVYSAPPSSKGFGDVILLGSRHCAGTLRLREFLARNGHPYTYIDLDTDQQAQELLDRFNVRR